MLWIFHDVFVPLRRKHFQAERYSQQCTGMSEKTWLLTLIAANAACVAATSFTPY